MTLASIGPGIILASSIVGSGELIAAGAPVTPAGREWNRVHDAAAVVVGVVTSLLLSFGRYRAIDARLVPSKPWDLL